MSILVVQQKLKAAGYDPGSLDGQWGAKTSAALDLALGPHRSVEHGSSLAWGLRVSEVFRGKVFALCGRLGMNPDYLMACMAWESAETFSASIRNAAGSGAVGLIQFMPATAVGMHVTTGAMALMTPEIQLDYVEQYFKPYKGRLHSLSDHYMAILWPAAIGKPESSALWDKASRPTTYRQNAGLDVSHDGVITKAEAAGMVEAKLLKGMLLSNRWAS